jgi:hypothetical protein
MRLKTKSIFAIALLGIMITFQARAQEVKIVSMTKYLSTCLYNFSRTINWPQECKTGDFVVAVIGDKDLAEALTALTRNYKVGLQPFVVKYFRTADEIQGFQHMIFIDVWQATKINRVLARIGNQSTLVVTEMEGFIDRGAMINFIPVNGLMQFEISKKQLAERNLIASSQLIRMGVSVD